MAIEKIPENWYIGGPTYPSSFTKDRITLIQTVNYLTAKIQECIETINAVDPTQVNEFIDLVNQLNEAVTQLTSEVNSATETANNASQTATSAKQTADGLAGEIAQANTTASEAKSTANSANTTAQSASSKADNAVSVANEANGKSDNAVQTSNAATTAANEAKVAAQAAQNSATSALSNASTALSTANQALTKSETAISSAETANDTAADAKTTAEGIASTAQGAVDTANEAKSTADAASAKVDSFVPGHTIVNSSGGSLPTRNKLQFKGAVVSDNSGGDSTIVEIQGGVINSETTVAFEEGQVIVQEGGKAKGKTLTASDVGAEPANFIGKMLWSGSFSSGTIQVTGISNYALIAVKLEGGVFCFGSVVYGIGGIVNYGAYTTQIWGYRFSHSGDTLAITETEIGGSDGTKNVPVIEIYGMF